MRTEKREDPLVELGYEIRDINVKGVRTAALGITGFFVFCVIASVGIYYLMNPSFHRDMVRHDRQLPGGANPLLQDNMTTKTDIMVLRRNEADALEGNVKQNDDGSYRIPIEAAMEIVARSGGKIGAASPDVTIESTRPEAPRSEEVPETTL